MIKIHQQGMVYENGKLAESPVAAVTRQGAEKTMAYRILQKHVKYMHIKDCRMSDGQVQPCGYGDGKIAEIFRELDKKGFEGFLSLEPHLSKFDGFDGLELEGGKKQAIFAMEDSGAKTYNVAAEALFATLRSVGLEPSFDW